MSRWRCCKAAGSALPPGRGSHAQDRSPALGSHRLWVLPASGRAGVSWKQRSAADALSPASLQHGEDAGCWEGAAAPWTDAAGVGVWWGRKPGRGLVLQRRMRGVLLWGRCNPRRAQESPAPAAGARRPPCSLLPNSHHHKGINPSASRAMQSQGQSPPGGPRLEECVPHPGALGRGHEVSLPVLPVSARPGHPPPARILLPLATPPLVCPAGIALHPKATGWPSAASAHQPRASLLHLRHSCGHPEQQYDPSPAARLTPWLPRQLHPEMLFWLGPNPASQNSAGWKGRE